MHVVRTKNYASLPKKLTQAGNKIFKFIFRDSLERGGGTNFATCFFAEVSKGGGPFANQFLVMLSYTTLFAPDQCVVLVEL